jgi:hypothetical protein
MPIIDVDRYYYLAGRALPFLPSQDGKPARSSSMASAEIRDGGGGGGNCGAEPTNRKPWNNKRKGASKNFHLLIVDTAYERKKERKHFSVETHTQISSPVLF